MAERDSRKGPGGSRDCDPRADRTGRGATGAIGSYDPRVAVNMLMSAGEGAAGAEYTLHPDPGTLLMWHASLNHLVHPNESQETRISISFNIVLEWLNHYASDV